MATLTAASSSSSSYMCLTKVSSPPLPSTSFPISFPYHPKLPRDSSFSLASPVTSRTSVRFNPSFARDDEFGDFVEMKETSETRLYSLSPFPLLFIAALPGAGTVRSLFGPFVELVKSWNLPEWLVHWGHPGNMAVVLFAMGGYGTYLGFRIRYSDNVEEKANAKDLHPKLLGGMFFFFALGATGGITSLLTSDKPIFESPHAVTGFIGLTLLTVQTLLPSLFENNPGLRNVHGILGSGIMTLFLIHAALGLQLGLSY
ncbi:uncharacterized protein LOC120072635 [Benincasa hispida]|uniref:uncharacterized protein LOC120072635 n=1 Tax=Benincasa hispida TaxID=102211 RepID=UPI0019003E12|nr:uncharacterized protein LOC120072635 [Benincasa hispida]